MGIRGEARKAGPAQRVTDMPRSFNWALVWCGATNRFDPGGPRGQTVLLEGPEAAVKDDRQGEAEVGQEASGDQGQVSKSLESATVGEGEAGRRRDQGLGDPTGVEVRQGPAQSVARVSRAGSRGSIPPGELAGSVLDPWNRRCP